MDRCAPTTLDTASRRARWGHDEARDVRCSSLPDHPTSRAELATAYFKQTLDREDVQQRLRDNPYRRVSLGMPIESPLYVART